MKAVIVFLASLLPLQALGQVPTHKPLRPVPAATSPPVTISPDVRAGVPSGFVWSNELRGYVQSSSIPQAFGSPSATTARFTDPIYNYHRRRGDWSFPGELRSHLMGPPHNLSRDYVYSLSRNQVLTLHNNLHTGRQAVRRSVQPFRRQYCPT